MNTKTGIFSNIKGDLFGGLTAGIVALPLALAFGLQSGLGASAGLYGAVCIGIFASIFGGTPSQISGPTGPMTVVSASIAANAIQSAGTLDKGIGIVIVTFMLAGLFQLVFGFLKIGRYIKYIPYPVISGFMSGIGIIIILFQLYPMLGSASTSNIMDLVLNIAEPLSNVNVWSVILAIGTVLIIYLFPLISKTIPSTLVALVVMTVVAWLADFNVDRISGVPDGLPEFEFLSVFNIQLKDIANAMIPAVSLAGLGSIDSLLTSVVADNITKTQHNSNRELIGQGIGNFVAAIAGGIPGAGATMRTVVNVQSGGRTQLSGIVHGLFLLAVVLGAGPLVSLIPNSVLAGILITVGVGIIDRKGLRDLVYIPRADAVILILVLLLTVFVDLLQAVGIGMVIASVLFMKKASDIVEQGTSIMPVAPTDRESPWDDESIIPEQVQKHIYILRLDGPLFFGSVNHLRRIASGIPDEVKVVVIRMKRVPYMDQSGLYSLESIVRNMIDKDVCILITMIQPQPSYMLQNVRLVPDLIPEKHLFDNLEDCSNWIQEYLKN
ncbi:MAG: sodium-independent anion transporter [Marinilabiliales bacterium]|nr:MAG: sodium-independent anion transporter [Marinilabiliales bacterium]